MRTITDLINRLNEAKQALPEAFGLTAESMAATAKALAQVTIEKEPILGKYSDGVVPAFWLEGKELNAAGSSFIAKKMEEKEGKNRVTNWKELRNAQGLQTNHVDLTYSGEMWRGLLPQPYREEGGRFISVLAHNNQDGQDKLNWNRKRYDDFISKALNTGDNRELLKGVAEEELARFLSNYL